MSIIYSLPASLPSLYTSHTDIFSYRLYRVSSVRPSLNAPSDIMDTHTTVQVSHQHNKIYKLMDASQHPSDPPFSTLLRHVSYLNQLNLSLDGTKFTCCINAYRLHLLMQQS